MMRVIGLTGPKGAGKDTVAHIIKSKYSPIEGVTVTAFADPIREVVEDIFQLPSELRPDSYDKFKRTNLLYDLPTIGMEAVAGRRVVREIGMLMRRYDEHQFTRYAERRMAADPEHIHVISDLRFENEYNMLAKYHAVIIKIVRPNYDYDGHVTERGFPDEHAHYIINNNGNIDTLEHNVEIVMTEIIKGWK